MSLMSEKLAARPKAGIPDAIIMGIAIIFVVGLKTFAGACVHDDGSAAACEIAAGTLFGLGLVAVVIAIMRIRANDYSSKRSYDIILIVLGLIFALAPGNLLDICTGEYMQCVNVMLPFARIMGCLLAGCSFAFELLFDLDR